MNDLLPDFWSFDELAEVSLSCRESAMWLAPDRVGEIAEKSPKRASECEVRRRRAEWAVALKRRYDPKVAAWVDTGVHGEKAAAVCLFERRGQTLIVVAFRGSKQSVRPRPADLHARAPPRTTEMMRAAALCAAARLPVNRPLAVAHPPHRRRSPRSRRRRRRRAGRVAVGDAARRESSTVLHPWSVARIRGA